MWHKYTALFSKTVFDRIALINNHWNHYSIIQQVEAGAFKSKTVLKKVSSIQDYYINFPCPAQHQIVKILEQNGPTNFYPLIQNGVDVHYYKKGEFLDTQSQVDPDSVFDMQQANYQDKRIHGMDHKAYENPRTFESKIFSNLPEKKYVAGLVALESLITSANLNLTPEQYFKISNALQQLGKTCNDLKAHQEIWAQNLHYFPKEYIPPMRIPRNFSLENLTADAKAELLRSEKRMSKISEYLFKQKIPENDYKKALTLFEDSFMQQLLGEA